MGLLFTPELIWTTAKFRLAAQAIKAIYAIRLYQISFGQFSHQDMFKLLDSMLVPILTYGTEIWSHSYSLDIEKSEN